MDFAISKEKIEGLWIARDEAELKWQGLESGGGHAQ
jgi:hypothetical protein